MNVSQKNYLVKLTFAAVCLALCMVLPLLTGQIPQVGSMLSPMHIPVLLCGFICGCPYGLAVGFIAPLLRFLIFSMPPLFPVGVSMAFELAAYGAFTGLLYKALPKKIPYVYASLVLSMLIGKVVWGAVRFIIAGLNHSDFSFSMFLAGAFIDAVPGIILHIVLVPLLVIALQRARIILK